MSEVLKAGAKAIGTKDLCGERVAPATKEEGVVMVFDNSMMLATRCHERSLK